MKTKLSSKESKHYSSHVRAVRKASQELRTKRKAGKRIVWEATI